MSEPMTDHANSARLDRALRLTRAGLWWESLARSFWPAASLLLLMITALSFGLAEALPDPVRPYAAAGAGVVFLATLVLGFLRFRRPRSHEAEDRIDETLPGRPLSALRDRPALGGDGALWQAHLAQMEQRVASARAVRPDAGLNRRDPFAFRLVALTAIAMALLFGSTGQLGQGLAALAPNRQQEGSPEAASGGPGWEGWAEPPAYTRKPTIYLNRLAADAVLDLPEGSVISLRLYGEEDRVAQDVGSELPESEQGAPQFRVERDGTLTIADRSIKVTVRPDDPPEITLGPPAERRADGRLIQPFSAQDDFGLSEGHAVITLDMGAIDRNFGLATDPEPRDPVQIKLPVRANRAEFEGQLVADLKKHAWANLPVKIRLNAQDGIGQSAQSGEIAMELPGRRFFDPFAAALIELRRDLLWSRENAARSAQILRAITWQPEGFIRDDTLGDLRAIISGLETAGLSDTQRDALAEALWRTAVQLEDGGLADALERMQRAQERLAQAMRRGASPDEIRDLMDELRRATDDYLDRLAEQGGDPADRFDRSPVQMMSGDQIQQMMDEIQRLMNEGKMAEAQALLEQFNRMMENMQVRQAEGEGQGEGRGSSSRMADTLREQQDLADRAFREMQDQWMGLDEQDQEEPSDSLAEQQRRLRDDLGMQRSLLPERGTPQGNAAGEAMDRAGRAMQQAEQALRQGDMAGALDRQAEAIEALRDGTRSLDQGRQQGEDGQQTQSGEGEDAQQGQQQGGAQPGENGQRGLASPRRDPLGRAMQGNGGGIATDAPLEDGESGENRARDLQDEIRRRLGQQDRPEQEREYLDRLIDQF
ncbi:DUF4175 domain-containing protein [Paracoccus aerodenitrificans]|uniref:DUF4175 domain-containing protein n=1 Tax=Paracoccus aerodenitrificans TaxID=3017781 RepID=UPI0022F0A781|nr:DUF4175 family protein [Paracoccus aerodenitrificans]WBU64362.1 DUF4175 family protein [Paracoccus aerodenitrificans]